LGSGNGAARLGKLGAGIQGSAEATGSSRDGDEPLRLRRDLAVFTYVGPLLESEAGISEASLPALLLLYGIGGTIKLIAGGRIGDGKALQSVVGMFVALAILYGALAAFIGSFVLVWAAMVAWGFLFLAPCVPLQARVVREAKEGPNLASTLNQSAFNVGNALGPSLGAVALSLGFGFRWLPLLGAFMALAGAWVGIVRV
jgi:MFS transporter, DHA1 family, inner membrane transport protein